LAQIGGRGGNLIIVDGPMKAADAMSEVKREAITQWRTIPISTAATALS
jgi:hypothetical protein